MGRKVSDRFAVPICRLHHRELHRHGNERAWWQSQGIDPLPLRQAFGAGRMRLRRLQSRVIRSARRDNGWHFETRVSAAAGTQNDETKPIRGPEAG
jgi:hypothetical protein